MIDTQKQDWIGFDDRWFMLVGMPVLALISTSLLNSSFYSIIDFVVSFFVALLFTMANWSLMRWVMILLRMRYPDIADTFKRGMILLVCIVSIVLGINQIGNALLSMGFGSSYNGADYTGILIVVLISIMTMAIYEATYYFNQLKAYIVKEEQTKQMVIESKLQALSNQAQPHFLFNSLNTLRDIIQNDPKESATTFVDRLADIYRFILDTGKTNLVPVKEEVAFAKAYLHIQSERFGKNLQVLWQLPPEVYQAKIMPMTLQLLLENAIKHNVISAARPLTIEVLYEDQAIIVKNKLQPKSTKMPSTKIGLQSIEKRYDLVGLHIPKTEHTATHFVVSIPLALETQ